MPNYLRNYIREILLTEAEERKSNASVYRDIERGQDIFKFNGSRLTLRDPSSRPFVGLTSGALDAVFVGIIEKAGYEVVGTVPPGTAIDGKVFSSAYNTYKVMSASTIAQTEGDQKSYYIIFGIRFSAAESIQFEAIRAGLMKAISENEGNPISVWNGAEFVEVDDADRIGGAGAKADVILTHRGSPAISISLKNLATGKGSDMQQWSGVSGAMTHPEVASFAERMTQASSSGEGSKFWRRIEDEDLKMKAVWGPLGETVDVIVAGTTPRLEPAGEPGTYRIEVGIGKHGTGGVFYKTDRIIPDGELEPVFFARKEDKKRLGTLRGVRGTIAPIALATSRSATEV